MWRGGKRCNAERVGRRISRTTEKQERHRGSDRLLRQSGKEGHELLGVLSLSSRKDAFLFRQLARSVLPLLRLRRERGRDHFHPRDRVRRLCRRGQDSRGTGKNAAARHEFRFGKDARTKAQARRGVEDTQCGGAFLPRQSQFRQSGRAYPIYFGQKAVRAHGGQPRGHAAADQKAAGIQRVIRVL